ncbi:hypothetical protein G9A89_003498 [Geosiphon pyriformis]|nr:hypothetical protein G9A89_003498 [Geosiphon pyriformis]
MTQFTDNKKTFTDSISQDGKVEINDIEQPPPPYDATTSNPLPIIPKAALTNYSTNRIQVNTPQQPEQQQHVNIPFTVVESKIPTTKEKKTGCCADFWHSVIDPKAWLSCFYFLFISFPIGVAAFCWILSTFIGAVVSLLFPPVGYFLCIATAWSWRALARLELATATMCTLNQPRIESFPPITKISRTPIEKQTWFTYATGICFDRFTWMSFVYFIFVKFAICIATFILVTILVCFAFPFMLIFMPIMCVICRKMGEWQFKMAKKILLA